MNVFHKILSKAFFFSPNSHIVGKKYLQDLKYSIGEASSRRFIQVGGLKDIAHEPKWLIGKGRVIKNISDGFNLL